MQRWKNTVLLVFCVGGLLLACAALYIHGERIRTLEVKSDLPLHPIASPSYTSTFRTVSNLPIHSHLHRRSDSYKGVFAEHLKNSSDSAQPVTSTELNSSRLKRQLDFGSDDEVEKTTIAATSTTSTTPKSRVFTPRPFKKVLKFGKGTSVPQFSPSSTEKSAAETTKPKKTFRPLKPSIKFRSTPEEDDNDDRYDIPQEDRTNFTLEVVQVERKVVRKEDGQLPTVLFAKANGKVNYVEPRMINGKSMPSVVYKQGLDIGPGPTSKRPYVKHKSASTESSSYELDNIDEGRIVINPNQNYDEEVSDEDLKDYHDGYSTFGAKGNFTHTVLSRNVAGFIPNGKIPASNGNPVFIKKRKGDSLASPSKKGRTEPTIIIEKGKVTEKYPRKGINPFDNPNSEIYSVPGGRHNPEDDDEETMPVYTFNRRDSKDKKNEERGENPKSNHLTSPAIPSSLEDLYRKGHPGVLPAPRKKSAYNKNGFPDSFPDSLDFDNPFQLSPEQDEPPLKFDPESDRFYGNPTPDNKEKIAQSNSPIGAENRNGKANDQEEDYRDYFSRKPAKRARTTSEEDDSSSSAEAPAANPSPNQFFYGRPYNPPEYSNDYDTDRGNNNSNDYDSDRGDNNANEGEHQGQSPFEYSGIDDNFEPSAADDYDDYGRGGNQGYVRRSDTGSEPPPVPTSSDEANADDGEDQGTTTPVQENPPVRNSRRPPPPPPLPPRGAPNREADYDNNDQSQEKDYGLGGFSPPPVEDGPEEGGYDTGFINTLKQFDEEIRKLQDQERHKLLHTPPVQQSQQLPPPTGGSGPGGNGYKHQGPPLIITSPGPLDPNSPGEHHEATSNAPGDENEPTDSQQFSPDSAEGSNEATEPNSADESDRNKDYDANISTEKSEESEDGPTKR